MWIEHNNQQQQHPATTSRDHFLRVEFPFGCGRLDSTMMMMMKRGPLNIPIVWRGLEFHFITHTRTDGRTDGRTL
jgi:hypothetical protein